MLPQKHPPEVRQKSEQLGLPLHSVANWQNSAQAPEQAGEAACANAGIRKLVNTGADQAIAAPAPIRVSMRRREMSFGRFSEFISHPHPDPSKRHQHERAERPGHPAGAVSFLTREGASDVVFLRSGPA